MVSTSAPGLGPVPDDADGPRLSPGQRALLGLGGLWLGAGLLLGLLEAVQRLGSGTLAERSFALFAEEEQRFRALGVSGRARNLLHGATPRRAEVYLRTDPGLEGVKLHVELTHLVYPRAVHHMVGPLPGPEFVRRHLGRGGWVLDTSTAAPFDWTQVAKEAARDGELVLWRVPPGGAR